MLEDNALAQECDGVVKTIAFHLGVSPQRVHQILANDPFAAYIRVHRGLAAADPQRAQRMADLFNSIHDSLAKPRSLRSEQQIVCALARESGENIATAVSDADISQKLKEAIEHQEVNAEYIAFLFAEQAARKGQGAEGGSQLRAS